MSYGSVYLINGSITYTTAEILALISAKAASSHTHAISDITGLSAALADAGLTGAELVTALNSQLGSTVWQSNSWGTITGTLSSQTDLQSALDAKAASSHTHTLSQITDVTVTSDMVSIPKGLRPGLYDDLGTPPVGTIIESSNDGHLYWVHRDGNVHLLCDSGGYGSGEYLPLAGGTMTGGIKYTEITHTPTGNTVTIDLGAANHQALSLVSSSGNMNVTFTPPATASQGTLMLMQHATTPRFIYWGVTGSYVFWQFSNVNFYNDGVSAVRVLYWRFNAAIGLIMWAGEPVVDVYDTHSGGLETTTSPTGTSATLTIANGNNQTLNLSSTTGDTTATIQLPAVRTSCAGTFVVVQHGTTARNITWAVSSGMIVWLGTQPTWSSDAVSKIRIVYWRYNGNVTYLWSTASN